jgi:hypothetical protein
MTHQCPKCSLDMTSSRATSAIGKFSAIKEPVKNFTTKESSPLIPYVCSKCGLTEWYVEKPENFK